MQTTIDGRLELAGRDGYGYTPRQSAVVRWMLEHGGEIRSTQAGVVSHRFREKGCTTAASASADRWTPGARSAACCTFACRDGSALMRRLADRRVVYRSGPGVWRLWS